MASLVVGARPELERDTTEKSTALVRPVTITTSRPHHEGETGTRRAQKTRSHLGHHTTDGRSNHDMK